MKITSTRFTTQTRRWLLIAGLTALLIGIGALVRGAFLYFFAGLAVATQHPRLLVLDRFALKANRARPIEPGSMPELEVMVQDLAGEHAFPRLACTSSRLNSRMRSRPDAILGMPPSVTEGLLRQLPPDQVKSVLAHELGHITNRDILGLLDCREGGGRDRGDREHLSVLALLRRRGRGRRSAQLDGHGAHIAPEKGGATCPTTSTSPSRT